MRLEKIAIFGPGLLGGSLALAIEKRGIAQELTLYGRQESSLDPIRKANKTWTLTTDPLLAAQGASLLILCLPVGAMRSIMEAALPGLSPQTIVTDVGSVKGFIVEEMEVLLQGKALWIGSHPMAGGEKTGFTAAREDLFEKAVTILTPTSSTHPQARETVEAFWKALGSHPLELEPHLHDYLVAQISHLPHLIAAALMHSCQPESYQLAGNGFRDTTRIASGPAPMWTEILLSNQIALCQALDHLIHQLHGVRDFLKNHQEKDLHQWLATAKHKRQQINNHYG